MDEQLDCMIIGGGPAGLTAAIYLARFHLKAMVVDEGKSRALLIPKSHNLPGFPEGISGHDYLALLREHARSYGAVMVNGRIDDLEKTSVGFVARFGATSIFARAIFLATGVTNNRPDMKDDTHAQALARGHLRYCPICDGYEISGQNIAVIGFEERVICEAEFMRSFTDRVTVISTTGDTLGDDHLRRLERIGAQFRLGPITAIHLRPSGLEVATAAETAIYDAVYPALGSSIHSGLAQKLGAAASEDGCMEVDRHQRTSVKYLYSAGDVVNGLDQISVCIGQAAIAAVAIRNDLCDEQQMLWTAPLKERSALS
jgi:thioredoxin reductase (NADPH)